MTIPKKNQVDYLSKLLVKLTNDCYGEVAGLVLGSMLDMGPATLGQIHARSGLGANDVRMVLGVLVHNGFVTHKKDDKNEKIYYTVSTRNVLSLLRQDQFLACVREKLGDQAGLLTSSVLEHGNMSLTGILVSLGKKIHENDSMTKESLVKMLTELQNTFIKLVNKNYFQKFNNSEAVTKFEVKDIAAIIVEGQEDVPKDNQHYCVNQVKLSTVVRDKLLIDAVTRKDPEAAKVYQSVLELVSHQPGYDAGVSAPLSFTDIQRQVILEHGGDSHAAIYTEQFLQVLTNHKARFVDKVGDSGGGQFQVSVKHLIGCFTECELDNIIQERFSSKASRVFRYIATLSVLTLTLTSLPGISESTSMLRSKISKEMS